MSDAGSWHLHQIPGEQDRIKGAKDICYLEAAIW
jgi:hypothetical protein